MKTYNIKGWLGLGSAGWTVCLALIGMFEVSELFTWIALLYAILYGGVFVLLDACFSLQSGVSRLLWDVCLEVELSEYYGLAASVYLGRC